MTSQAGHYAGRYLYAFIQPSELPADMPVGIGGMPVYAVPHEGVSAVVSDTGLARVRPERRCLAAHHAVIQSLLRASAVLPAAFGTIATSDSALRKMLKRHHAALAGELSRVVGQVEMGVRVTWDVPNIFQYLVERRADLKAMRDSLQTSGGAISRDDKIELGSLFEQVLNEERERHARCVEAVLVACSRELQRSPPRRETEVMNLACLLPRNTIDEFENTMRDLAARLDDHLVVSYNGPWPPHHFIHLNIHA